MSVINLSNVNQILPVHLSQTDRKPGRKQMNALRYTVSGQLFPY